MSEIADRGDISELFSRLSRLLDEGRYDEGRYDDAHTVYADDAVVRSPRAALRGLDEVIAFLRRSHVDGERTLHVNADILVTVEGDRASASASQLVYFFRDGEPPHRSAALRLTCAAVRTPDGWRFGEADMEVAFQRAAA